MPEFRRNVGTLIGALPRGSRPKLVGYVVVQFFLSLLELVGIAAVLPILQVLSGASLTEGYIGALHRAFGAPERTTFVVLLCIVMAVAFIAKAAAALASQWWSLSFLASIQVHMSGMLLGRYLRASYLAHRRRSSAEIIRTVGGALVWALNGVLGGLMSLATTALMIGTVLVFLLIAVPVPALVALGYLGIAVFALQRLLSRPNRRAGELAQEASWASSRVLIETVNGFREVRMHNAEDHMVARFDEANSAAARASRTGSFLSSLPKQLLELLTVLGLGALLAVVASQNVTPDELVPTLGLIVAATFKLMPSVVGATATLGTIRQGQEGLRLTAEALRGYDPNELVVSQVDESIVPLSDHAQMLSVRDVSFRYPDGTRQVVSRVSIDVPAGSSLALCGPSGSGKTTLSDIILGLIPPDSGEVTFGGTSIAAEAQRWRRSVAYVPQDVHVFDATVRENVAFGCPVESIDDDRVRDCLMRAELGDWLEQLPNGLASEVGERGKRLSGGQRQRLGIARALYRDPVVLVLDEATSALDNETEHRIAAAIGRLGGQVTTIIVAHRLSTVRDVDQLVYMEDGVVISRGTFDEVQRSSAAFAHLVELGTLPPAASA